MDSTFFTLALVVGVVGCSSKGPLAADDSSASSSTGVLTTLSDDGANTPQGRVEGTISAVNAAEENLRLNSQPVANIFLSAARKFRRKS